MTTITTNTQRLLNAVAAANTFMPKEGDFVGQICLTGANSMLQVKAMDMIQSVIFKEIEFVSSDLTQDSISSFSIDGKKLLTVLKNAKTDEINFEIHSEHILVKSGRSKIKVDTLAKTQEVEIEIGVGASFDIGNNIGAMQQVLHSVDQNSAKFELGGVLLQVKNGNFHVVGTDTKRLVAISYGTDIDDVEVIVPKKGIETISKLFSGSDISAEIDKNTLKVYSESAMYETKLISGKFPEWQRIVPRDVTQTVSLNRDNFESMVKEASIFESSIVVRIQNGEIKITDASANTEIVVETEDHKANIVFSIDAKYALEFLTTISEEQFEIDYNESMLPIVFKANANHKEIIMPLAMPEEDEVQEEEAA